MKLVMDGRLDVRNYLLKTLIIWCVVASFLLWFLYRLLVEAKLGLPIECFFMAQIFVVLLVAPYLAARACNTDNISGNTRFDAQLQLTRNLPASAERLLKVLLVSQIPLLFWICLSTIAAVWVTGLPLVKMCQILVILAMYSISAGAVGIAGAQIFRDALFGTEFAILLWALLIGGVFLLNPLKRYVKDLQPFIPIALHVNPVIAVCCIFEDLDIFRMPILYERTPVPSYIFLYPKPWYLVGLWQMVIGGCCFLGAWQIGKFRKYIVRR